MQSELSIVRPTAPVQGPPDGRLRTQAPLTAREPLESVDVAVVGGGLAGLAAAATAARTGRSVALYEGGSGIGGRARTRTEHGFHFNVGAHAIYQNGPGLRALRDLGVEPRGGIVNPAGSVAQRSGRLDLLPVDAG